jgi:hypothetical protein
MPADRRDCDVVRHRSPACLLENGRHSPSRLNCENQPAVNAREINRVVSTAGVRLKRLLRVPTFVKIRTVTVCLDASGRFPRVCGVCGLHGSDLDHVCRFALTAMVRCSQSRQRTSTYDAYPASTKRPVLTAKELSHACLPAGRRCSTKREFSAALQ